MKPFKLLLVLCWLIVNCSLEKTVWTVNVYQRWADKKEFGRLINAGDPISLSDAETFSYLGINESEVDVDNNDPNAIANAILKPPVLMTERELNEMLKEEDLASPKTMTAQKFKLPTVKK